MSFSSNFKGSQFEASSILVSSMLFSSMRVSSTLVSPNEFEASSAAPEIFESNFEDTSQSRSLFFLIYSAVSIRNAAIEAA